MGPGFEEFGRISFFWGRNSPFLTVVGCGKGPFAVLSARSRIYKNFTILLLWGLKEVYYGRGRRLSVFSKWMDTMVNNLYWNVYRNLEREVLAIADTIHVDDEQINVYSMKIADLLVRSATEVESISKELYYLNGGPKSKTGKYPYFDSDCIKFLNQKWGLDKKKVFLSSPYFYVENKEYIELTPLNNAGEKHANQWLNAYQAVKHDRANSLEQGNVKNLLQAMAGLFILNIYYKNDVFPLTTNLLTNFDCSMGSLLFSVKVHEFPGISAADIYEKNKYFDECVYLVRAVETSKKEFLDISKEIEECRKNIACERITKEVNERRINLDDFSEDDQKKILSRYYDETLENVLRRYGQQLSHAIKKLKYECVLNVNQY